VIVVVLIVVLGSLMGEETKDEQVETIALNTYRGKPRHKRAKRWVG
jgi:hypothetical protein